MNNEVKKFLPIGTICRLKGGQKNVMIIGFCPISAELGEKMYDYCGCVYPEGMISSAVNLLFDNSQIEEILFKGYENDEEKQFKDTLNQLIASKTQSNVEEQKSNESNNVSNYINHTTSENNNLSSLSNQTPMFNTLNLNQQDNTNNN